MALKGGNDKIWQVAHAALFHVQQNYQSKLCPEAVYTLAIHPIAEDIPPYSLTHAKYKIRRGHTASGSLQPTRYADASSPHIVSLPSSRTVPLTATHRSSFAYSRTQDRDEEAARQLAIVNANATKGLLGMIKKGDEESKWRSTRCLVQLAFGNEETCKIISSTKAILAAADLVKNLEGVTDRVKEAALQLLNNLAANCPDCHKTIIATEVLTHVNALLRSITIPDPVKRAGVGVVYAMSTSETGRAELMELDAVSTLVPIIRSNKTTLNSIGATLSAANLIGHKVSE